MDRRHPLAKNPIFLSIIIFLCIIIIYYYSIIYNLYNLERISINNFETGDVIFMIDNHLLKGELAKFIICNLLYSFCTTLYTHVGVVFKRDSDLFIITAEANGKCLRVQRLSHLLNNYTGNFICFKNKKKLYDSDKRVHEFLNLNKNVQYHFNPLSFVKIVFGLNGNFPKNKTICTKNAIELLRHLGINLNIDPNSTEVRLLYNAISNSNYYSCSYPC